MVIQQPSEMTLRSRQQLLRLETMKPLRHQSRRVNLLRYIPQHLSDPPIRRMHRQGPLLLHRRRVIHDQQRSRELLLHTTLQHLQMSLPRRRHQEIQRQRQILQTTVRLDHSLHIVLRPQHLFQRANIGHLLLLIVHRVERVIDVSQSVVPATADLSRVYGSLDLRKL